MLAGTRMHAHAGKIPAPGTASSLSPSSSARLLLGICGCARVNEYEQRKRPAKTTDFCTRPHMCLLPGTALPQRHLEVRLQRHVLTSASILLGGEKKNLATTGAPACTHHACRSGKARQAHGQCVCPLPVPIGPAHHSQRIQRPPWFFCQCGGATGFQRHQRPCCSVPRRHWRLRRDCARRRAARHTGWQPRTQRAAGC